MTRKYLKSSHGALPTGSADVGDLVQIMLARIKAGGEPVVKNYARELDDWRGDILVGRDAMEQAADAVPTSLQDDIHYAHENIQNFARAQLASISEFETEVRPGLIAGQRLIPLEAAGCYVPGGRYSHIASALMTITTARVAGVHDITACSPPRKGVGIPPAILFAMGVAGADRALALGGVQGVAAMAGGMFGAIPADILVGPGNQFVAEAKRQLFGNVGIDMFAGPTDSMVVADRFADPELVAWDLVGQAEHGFNSPVWLVTDCPQLADSVLECVEFCIAELQEPNKSNARQAWDTLGEIILCDTREEMAQVADEYGPEHLHIQANDLDWWRCRLRSYGSLFLGAETTVPFGDKASGPNHVLPTSGAARYTGGLSVHKFLKTVTWQRVEPRALPDLARVSASISRHEGMEGHARSAEIRLEKFCAPLKRAVNGQG
ncbi:histidinol dehydrogenase [Shimia litoralis]|uniref:Histidinol dehydrogenase homolog n=1 Tax=Shimia litoralis TaxID=420403 RepID=A0A4V6F247_9RHOB|nr:histidinol dehydrogenase [Shimia litoralis]TKZ21901.1 histidinol dehydrogenase [Shimia litoralis]